jgi:ATP/maltotriose-dependent transcriptional regulator MalT
VLAFAAPGGFGKTALLTKLIQKLSDSGRPFVDSATLSNGELINPHVYEHLVQGLNRTGLLNDYAAMLMNKGNALQNLQR